MQVRKDDHVLVVFPSGRMDISQTANLEKEIASYVNDDPECDILFDLSNVEYLHSSAVRMLISLHIRLLENKKNISICNISPGVRKMLEFVDLDSMVNVYNCKDEAIRNLCSSPEENCERE